MRRFFSFDQLLQMSSGSQDPRNQFTVRQEGDKLVVIGTHNQVTLVPGSEMGCRDGDVWIPPNPHIEKDPLRKFLLMSRLSLRLLRYEAVADYDRHRHERFVAGNHEEGEGISKGATGIYNGDLVLVARRGNGFPLQIQSITVNPRLPFVHREELIPWLEEMIVTPEFMKHSLEKMPEAYDLARRICLRSGLRWNRNVLHQTGAHFRHKGVRHTIHLCRDFGRRDGEKMSWIPQIRRQLNGWSCALPLVECLNTGLLKEWAFSAEVFEYCGECGRYLVPVGSHKICPDCP